jgi:hypothetical protein
VNHHPFSITAIAIYAGFNALLLLVTGLLLTFSRPMTGPSGWPIVCGLVFLTVGVFIAAAIYGLLSRREWGRKILCGGLLFCLPLNVIAIFPVLQNHRMTTGNTLLQIACMLASIAAIRYLTKKQIVRTPSEEPRSEHPIYFQYRPADEEERPFTFDRRGHSEE